MQPRSEMKNVDLEVEETEASLKAVSVETVEVDESMGRGRWASKFHCSQAALHGANRHLDSLKEVRTLYLSDVKILICP